MGIRERKERERKKMQALIQDTAEKLFRKNGVDRISIRNIAAEIEYSPATIYLYFKDKNEIIGNLRGSFTDEFLRKLKEFGFIKDHFSRIKNMAHSWIEYAIDQHDQYEIIFMKNGQLNKNVIYQYLNEAVSQAVQAGQIQRMPVADATTMIISYLHGISMLAINRKFSLDSKTELKDQLVELINRFLNNMKGASMI